MKLCLVVPSVFLGLSSLVGCSADNPKDPPATSLGVDSGTAAGRDGGTDTAPTTDCVPGFEASEPCGRCGTRKRTCTQAGSWGEWSACAGEPKDAECAAGDVRNKACGNCGTRIDTCDPKRCSFSNGTCTGEGECAPGATDSRACASAGVVQSRACSGTCKWGDYSSCAAPTGWRALAAAPATFAARVDAASAWTGTELVVYGGSSDKGVLGDGARYALATDSWKALPAAPFAKGRARAAAVWTGKELVVWGGYGTDSVFAADGAAYDPVKDSWHVLAPSVLSARASVRAVWSPTTKQVLIWGGDAGSPSAEGAAYDPATDAWTRLPDAPIGARSGHGGAWVGAPCNCMAIWGGYSGGIDGLKDGATFDPSTSTWTKLPDVPTGFDPRYQHVAVGVGGDLLVWGGYGGTSFDSLAKNSGARWSSADGKWTALSVPDDVVLAPSAHRYESAGWSDGKKLWVWSGATPTMPTPARGGAVYDLAAGAWTRMDDTGAPAPRRNAIAVWTGTEELVWGGTDGVGKYFADGAIFHP
ncbi:MAG: hypothetical protein NVSMB47_08330 [Polyangiales bacterium]